MTTWIALLRAVNVGGTGKIAMTDLKAICEAADCRAVRTYIASGMELGQREIYVSYGPNMGRSKLKIPAAKSGTARNMNTVAKLASMGSESAKK